MPRLGPLTQPGPKLGVFPPVFTSQREGSFVCVIC